MSHFHLMKQGQTQPKAGQREETIKIKTEINEAENRKITENQRNQNWFLEISKTVKPPARLLGQGRGREGASIRTMKGITTDFSSYLETSRGLLGTMWIKWTGHRTSWMK